ncbi:hypothetical protein F5144DRAFT_597748 [Chaetomium tenue]|uniref:Uncharacterized protein n=1 Tax=Chaetomium tenue TaxID=1854479 RepID=A0ACB7PPK6_9PEZI|nr:hypothetical protein F5144DRAFT_597748 [Chaetomium globosum]
MQFFAVLATSVLALSSGVSAWTRDGRGVWVANNTWYTIRDTRVHEACTRMNDPNTILVGDSCTYWTDGAGGQFHGQCRSSGGTVSCS